MGLVGEASPVKWGRLHNYSGLSGLMAIQTTRLASVGWTVSITGGHGADRRPLAPVLSAAGSQGSAN